MKNHNRETTNAFITFDLIQGYLALKGGIFHFYKLSRESLRNDELEAGDARKAEEAA
jgi:hypothetical protein